MRFRLLLISSIIVEAIQFFQIPVALGDEGKFFYKKGELLYEASMADAETVEDWKMEGVAELKFKDEWMHMFSPKEKSHHVFWCPVTVPDSFIAEWDAQNIETDAGLCIVFFAAKGEGGEDIFAPNLPKRDGEFKQYTRGAIVSYHISYYANSANNPDRSYSNLRKNNKFVLVQKGKEGIPTKSKKIHQMRLVKNKSHIAMFVDGRKIIDWTDDGKNYGPAYAGGKIGFRQMRWTHFRYRNFKVWSLVPEETTSECSGQQVPDTSLNELSSKVMC